MATRNRQGKQSKTTPGTKTTRRGSANRELLEQMAQVEQEYQLQSERERARKEEEHRLWLAGRLDEEHKRSAAGDIPDLVPPQADERDKMVWLKKQPLTVAACAERARLPHAVAVHFLERFGAGEFYCLKYSWADHCDPSWPTGELEKQFDEALTAWKAKQQQIKAQQQLRLEEMEISDLEDSYDIQDSEVLLDCDEYHDERHRWLAEGLLLEKQAAMMGGPVKSMKTSILVDLALSVATGQPFLGTFAIPHPAPVMIIFGENTDTHIAKLANRIGAKKADYKRAPVHWCFRMPRLDNEHELQQLGRIVRHRHIGLVIIDPVYLAFPSSGSMAPNVFDMGRLLKQVATACLKAGATPLFSYHTTKDLSPGKPTTLTDLAFAGVAEFARQWVLLNRRMAYDPNQPGEHALLLSYGGAAGQSGIRALDISEGQLQADFTGRKWDVRLAPYVPEASKKRQANRKTTPPTATTTVQRHAEKVLQAIADLGGKAGQGVPRKSVQKHTGLNGAALGAALDLLKEQKLVKVTEQAATHGNGAFKAQILHLVPASLQLVAGVNDPEVNAGVGREC